MLVLLLVLRQVALLRKAIGGMGKYDFLVFTHA